MFVIFSAKANIALHGRSALYLKGSIFFCKINPVIRTTDYLGDLFVVKAKK